MLTVQLGQCGNQLGSALFRRIANEERVRNGENDEAIRNTFFRESRSRVRPRNGSPLVRALMIDTEPKVLSKCVEESSHHGGWAYGEDARICEQTGSGNNWAFGSRIHGPALRRRASDALRRLVEEMDRCPSFLILQSVAGGTGSGVGSYLTRVIRDEYDASSVFNVAVWPYETGEVIVQNYNAVLTLSELTQASDGVILFENTSLHDMCTKLLRIKRPSFSDLNDAIATHLVNVLFPTSTDTQRRRRVVGLDEIAESLCAHPGYRLLNVRSIPQVSERSKAFTSRTWRGLLKHLRQMLIADSSLEEGINWNISLRHKSINRSIAGRLILRGTGAYDVDVDTFRAPELYAPWAMDRFHVRRDTRQLCGNEKSATLLSNSQSVVPPIERALSKAWEMFESHAYVHQYTRHGVEEGDFVASLIRTEQIVKNYKSI